MPNLENFRLIDPGRLRLGERLRFLFYGRAYKRRFAVRARQYGIFFSSRQLFYWFPFAIVAAAMLLAIGWLGAQLQEARIRNQTMAADLRAVRQRQAPLPQTTPPAPEVPTVRENPDHGMRQARSDLQQARADLELVRAGSRDLDAQLKSAREQIDSLRSEMAGSKMAETRLSDRLRDSELRLGGMTAELARLQAGRSEDAAIIGAQKFRLGELAGQFNAMSDTIGRERKLLVADLDIRDLMGARSLHIVDVFDVDGKGKTQRPFGRIFYTEGKSLIFYAFDLKNGGTFQAWGQREARDESAQSLGIFYVDDQKQNRWVLKFDNPKVLAEINAVFVTVEPPGGSVKPNRQKMLYAYLNATPNHP